MKTNKLAIIWVIATTTITVCSAQNTETPDPYSLFGKIHVLGDERQTADKIFVIRNFPPDSPVDRIEHHTRSGMIKVFGKDGKLAGEKQLSDTENAWTTPDPLAEKYYSISPYAYCANNPIRYVDPDGRTIEIYDFVDEQKITYQWKQYEGNWGFYDSNNTSYSGNNEFIGQLSTALSDLMGGGNAGYNLVDNIVNMESIITIGTNRQGSNQYYPETSALSWNPNGNSKVPTQNGNDSNVPFVSLGHELAHAWDYTQGTPNNGIWIDGGIYNTKNILNSDIYATHTENRIRAENNLQLRTHYLINSSGTGVEPQILDSKGRSMYYDINDKTNYTKVPRKNRFTY